MSLQQSRSALSRPRKQAFRSTALSALTRQLLYSPPDKRAEAVLHAETLHDELEADKNYPIDFVVYRLTDRRVPPSESVMLVGEAIQPDLRLMIDALSRSIELPCDDRDPGKTTKELAESLGVSAKTIARWRDKGLRWRWGVRSGKPTVLITKSALDAFKHNDQQRISKAATFSRFSDAEKARVLNRARRLSQATDVPPQLVLNHLAKRSGRSVEALRALSRRHDEANPEDRIFNDHTGPLTAQQKAEIDDAYSQGVTVSAICQRFRKTRSTIYRTIHEARAERIKAMKIRLVESPIFERPDADEVLMQPITRPGKPRHLGANVTDRLPSKLKSIYDRPVEPDNVIRSLTVRYNFLKYLAANLQQEIVQGTTRASDMDQFESLLGRIDQARGDVIAAVLPLTLSVVRRQQTNLQRDSSESLVQMLSIAHKVMFEEIDRFDASVAHTFESVLTNRLLRVLAKPTETHRTISEEDLVDQLVAAGFKGD